MKTLKEQLKKLKKLEVEEELIDIHIKALEANKAAIQTTMLEVKLEDFMNHGYMEKGDMNGGSCIFPIRKRNDKRIPNDKTILCLRVSYWNNAVHVELYDTEHPEGLLTNNTYNRYENDWKKYFDEMVESRFDKIFNEKIEVVPI